MMWHRMAVTALAMAALAAGGWLAADEPKAAPAKGHDRLDAMAAQLGLNDQQKEEIRKVHTDFEPKLADAEHHLWTLHHEEHEAMSKVLNDEQHEAAGAAQGGPRQGAGQARRQARPERRPEEEARGSPGRA